MRRLLLALPLACLPLAIAHADEHDSPGKHEHGVAALNVALDGHTLEIELESPAMNIVGFEHMPSSPADQTAASNARSALQKPLALFDLPAAAGCTVTAAEAESPLFGHDEHDAAHAEAHHHSDVDADYTLTCSTPQALTGIGLAPLFKQFPGLQKVQVQLIGPNGQKGADLTPDAATLTF